MKYIILEECDMEVAIIFDELLKHKQIAAGRKVISAGFVQLTNIGPAAYGESDGLGIKSRPQDSDIIKESMARKLLI
jgi:hypothetical protein